MKAIIDVQNLSVFASGKCLLRDVHLSIFPRQVCVIIGPSGAGKSTLLRSLNRLSDLDPKISRTGGILFHGESIYSPSIDLDALRTRIGMVFQQPVIFPGSIYKNVLFGASRVLRLSKAESAQVAESALRSAAVWEEVKDRLHDRAEKLSVGQQQRLCIARTLAVQPEVILMDEPTSALDVKSTEAIEDLIENLKREKTIVLVTHNMGKAERLADQLAWVEVKNGVGELSLERSGVVAAERYSEPIIS